MCRRAALGDGQPSLTRTCWRLRRHWRLTRRRNLQNDCAGPWLWRSRKPPRPKRGCRQPAGPRSLARSSAARPSLSLAAAASSSNEGPPPSEDNVAPAAAATYALATYYANHVCGHAYPLSRRAGPWALPTATQSAGTRNCEGRRPAVLSTTATTGNACAGMSNLFSQPYSIMI